MGFWQKLQSVSDQYAETTHCTVPFIDIAKQILNQCMTNCAYMYEMLVQIKPFKSYSRQYLRRGLELLANDSLDEREQFKIVISSLLAAKYYNDHHHAGDKYYQSNPLHLTVEMKYNLGTLLKPHEKPSFTEQDADFDNKIDVISSAVLNGEINLDKSLFINSSLISAELFNQKLQALCDRYEIGLSMEEQTESYRAPGASR